MALLKQKKLGAPIFPDISIDYIHSIIRRAYKKYFSRAKIVRGILVASTLFLLFMGGMAAWAFVVPMPALDNFQARNVPLSTKIYDRTGTVLLFDIHSSMRRTEVPLEDISKNLINATVAIEDDEFYSHKGIRPVSILRAFINDIFSWDFSQGGSTITQQVVKNSLLSPKKSISRKIKEMVFALRMERLYTKNQILSTYLNETPYGGVVYGVEEASQYYFGKKASDLTLAESAYIAALPKGPSYYSPYGSHRDLLDERKNLVLEKMKKLKFISADEYDLAKAEKVEFADRATAGIKAPHFVFYVRQKLIDTYGLEAVENGGLQVISTLDWDLEKKSEEIVADFSARNKKRFDGENAGLVAVDPKTGQILAMVGSRGYFDPDVDGKVNVALAKRQPGSSFKPIVYATAFEEGYTPETVVFDLKTQFSSSCSPDDFTTHDNCYSPDNFGKKTQGPISFRNALAQSVNIASVKVLYLAGIDNALTTAKKLGLTTLDDRKRFGLSLVLGGGEVTLLEMTGAYSVFANDGVRNPETAILEVRDKNGKVLEHYAPDPAIVLSPDTARTISDILSDNEARAPQFGYNSPLDFGETAVAAKTGTTNDFRDVWTVGYSSGIAVGVWVGNNNNRPMKTNITQPSAAPLWHAAMAEALKTYPALAFTKPAPKSEYAYLPAPLQGVWNPYPEAGIHDILFWVNRKDPLSGPPQNPYADPQFANWEYPVRQWGIAHATPVPQQEESPFYSNPVPVIAGQ